MSTKNNIKKIVEGRISEVYLTWGQLKEALDKLSEDELNKPVQVYPPHCTPEKVPLQPVYSFDKVGDLTEEGDTRDFIDNGHHPENYCLLADRNGISEDGDTLYEWREDGKLVGNNSGKIIDPFEIYKEKE